MTELDLFAAAIATADPAARAAVLDRECGDNPALRERLDKLLAAHFAAHQLLDPPDANGTVTHSPDNATFVPDPMPATVDRPGKNEHVGAILGGKYKLIEEIGEGGMGSVFMAQQTQPVKRAVAVKVIKAGMDSKAVLARFEAERQALAMMDHPNIARVLDAGTTESGRPYFVMELVKGVPITQYCDERKLTPRQRLELFVPVCNAIQHAHQKGIIHRDIKPSNVLVAMYDDRPVVKVIDFGVAKATGGALTEHTLDTGFGGVVGTPQYMSPEQATFNNLDIDTRSDVYALGVLLYELLTGSPPFSGKELQQKGVLEVLRVVREEEPPRPSTKLSTADALPTLSANRGTEPKKLTGLLRNELDWVVMKALEKDRTRRYETANGFAADVQRYLSGEAVVAHPPSTAYRIKKFVKRNRVQVIAAGLVFLALLAGIVGTTLGLVEARKQEHNAVAAQNAEADRAEGERLARLDAQEKEKLAVAAAEKERLATELTAERLKQIETINTTVFDIFAEFDIRKVKGGNDPVESVLAQKLIVAGKKLDEKAIQDPLVLANLRDRLGKTLVNLGEAPAAIEFLTAAVETRKAKLGPDHPDTLIGMGHMAVGYQDVGKLDLALPLFEETLKLRKARLGPDHPSTLTSMSNLASGYKAAGKLDLALLLFEEALKLQMVKLGPDHPSTLTSLNNLGMAYCEAKQGDKAASVLTALVAAQRKQFPKESPQFAGVLAQVALALLKCDQFATAEEMLRECLSIREKTQPDIWTTFNTQAMLGGALLGQKKYADAEPLLVKGYEGMKAREKSIPPQGINRIPESLDRLTELYTATNKPHEVKKYKELRAKYPTPKEVLPLPRKDK